MVSFLLLTFPIGEWVDLDVTATGRHHTVALNGEVVLVAEGPEIMPPEAWA